MAVYVTRYAVGDWVRPASPHGLRWIGQVASFTQDGHPIVSWTHNVPECIRTMLLPYAATELLPAASPYGPVSEP